MTTTNTMRRNQGPATKPDGRTAGKPRASVRADGLQNKDRRFVRIGHFVRVKPGHLYEGRAGFVRSAAERWIEVEIVGNRDRVGWQQRTCYTSDEVEDVMEDDNEIDQLGTRIARLEANANFASSERLAMALRARAARLRGCRRSVRRDAGCYLPALIVVDGRKS